MRRVAVWLCTALLTFSAGAACAFLWSLERGAAGRQGEGAAALAPARAPAPPASRAELPELPFCELVAAPEEYEGRVVRLRADYVFGIHGAMLRDRSCSSMEGPVWVSMSRSEWEGLERAMAEAYGTRRVAGPLHVVVVGRFGRNHSSGGSDSLEDNAPFKFELLRIESAARPR